MNSKDKLVVLLSRFPYPLEKGDKLRAFHQIAELSKTFDIYLIAITEKEIASEHHQQLALFCKEIHPVRITNRSILFNLFLSFISNKPFQSGYFFSYRGKNKVDLLLKSIRPNYIYSQLIRTSEYVKNYHACPKTIDYMDALSKGIERRIDKAPWYLKWIFRSEAKRLKNYERVIFDYFEHKTIISDQDREFILHPNRNEIVSIPNGIDERFFNFTKTQARYDLVFIGNLSYAPNVEAVEYIATALLTKNKQLTCLISGATPHPTIQKIARTTAQIELQGWIDDIREAYVSGKIFIAPMMIGTGMQNKLLEAMALGIPCITTTLANNAIQAIHNEHILVANTTDEFLAAINDLLTDQELYKRIATNGQAYIRENYSWKKSTQELAALISSN
jgi:glycosyltransferase involved in cell wall biosynthesis